MQRTALITGGVGELGTAIGERLAAQGCCVAALDVSVDTDRAHAWRERVARNGNDAMVVAADVTDYAACEEAVSEVTETLGGVDILVNCAGITRDASVRKMDKQKWDAVLGANLDSVFNMTKHVLDGMSDRGFGRIVNISSVNGQKGQFGQSNYSAAKAGMHGFTMAVAQEVARKGVTVNTVSPGYMETAMVRAVPQSVLESIVSQIPVGRLGKPDEIAAMVAFLVSEDASFITGANISVNGGLYMH